MPADERDAGVHTLPITVEYGSRTVTLTPTLVETERGPVLIDAGPEGALEGIRTHLRTIGYGLEDVWLVVLTHHDADHAGGLADLLEAVDAVVATHREEAPYVTGERDPIKGNGDRYPPVDVDLELAGGVRIPTLAGPMEVLETPGHSPGHVSLHFPEDGLLIAGDALVADDGGEGTEGERDPHRDAKRSEDGSRSSSELRSDVDGSLSGPKPEFTPDTDRALESVGDLATLEIDHVVCYHGGYVDRGSERIRELSERGLED